MNVWNKFWNWYENKILGSIVIIAIIQFIQVPHMVWNADIMLEAGIVSRVHPVIDWFLYGVDLIEIISIINVGMIMFSLIKKRQELRDFLDQMSDKEGKGERQAMDSADEASSINMKNLQSSIEKTEIDEVKLIEDALIRLDRGEYGVCIACEKPIAATRLEYYPYAARCISCQEKHEG